MGLWFVWKIDSFFGGICLGEGDWLGGVWVGLQV